MKISGTANGHTAITPGITTQTAGERLHRRIILFLIALLFIAFPISTGLSNTAAVLLILVVPLRWTAFVSALRTYPLWFIVVALGPLLVALLATPISLMEGISPVHAFGRHHKELLFIALLAAFTLYPAKKVALWGMGISAVVVALISIASWWSGINIYGAPYNPIKPIGMNYTFQNFILGAISIGMLHYAWHRDTLLSRRTRWIISFFAILCLSSVVFIVTGRTGQLATLLMALWLILATLSGRRRLQLLLGIVLILGLATTLSPEMRDRYGKISSEIEQFRNGNPLSSVGLRLDYWTHTLQLIQARPLIGYGTGSFGTVYERHLDINSTSPRITSHPHSDPLHYWMERGLLGLLSYVAVFIGLLKMSERLAAPQRDLLRALIVGFVFSSLINSFYRDWASGAFLLSIAALLCSTNERRL